MVDFTIGENPKNIVIIAKFTSLKKAKKPRGAKKRTERGWL
ncbi:MAG: hypothetical protein XD44_0931 [Methanobacteriaceae archaeon 41_258]|nr:MAG: hypothetical protein XD44_0931 [Methanobacteriaceae archaeon 41_258]